MTRPGARSQADFRGLGIHPTVAFIFIGYRIRYAVRSIGPWRAFNGLLARDTMRTSYLVCYAVCDDKRLRKVFKIMRGFCDHLQFSFFECQFTASDLIYSNNLSLPPGRYSVRFVVRDWLSGKIGSLSAPLTVELDRIRTNCERRAGHLQRLRGSGDRSSFFE